MVPRGRGGPTTIENTRCLCNSTTSSPRARSTATRGWTGSRCAAQSGAFSAG
ncbi:MAG TPA: hypothetical protein VF912_05805 [Anaeromyxobacter sp.]